MFFLKAGTDLQDYMIPQHQDQDMDFLSSENRISHPNVISNECLKVSTHFPIAVKLKHIKLEQNETFL
jgi:hypothetical protein